MLLPIWREPTSLLTVRGVGAAHAETQSSPKQVLRAPPSCPFMKTRKLGFREGKQLAYHHPVDRLPPWDSIQISDLTSTGYYDSLDVLQPHQEKTNGVWHCDLTGRVTLISASLSVRTKGGSGSQE